MKILVMKPSPLGKDLVENLKKIGINAWHFSFFDFYPSTSLINLSNKIDDFYKSDVIIIFSKQCIYYTNLYLKNHNLQWPYSPVYYTIGQSTAFSLYKHVKKKLFFLKIKKTAKIY